MAPKIPNKVKKQSSKQKRQTWQPSEQTSLSTLDEFCSNSASIYNWNRVQAALLKIPQSPQVEFKDSKPIESSVIKVIQTLVAQIQSSDAKLRSLNTQQEVMTEASRAEQS